MILDLCFRKKSLIHEASSTWEVHDSPLWNPWPEWLQDTDAGKRCSKTEILHITCSMSLHSKYQTAHLFCKDQEVTMIYLLLTWRKSLNMGSSSREHRTQDVSTCLKYIWAKRGTAMCIKLCAMQHSLQCLWVVLTLGLQYRFCLAKHPLWLQPCQN